MEKYMNRIEKKMEIISRRVIDFEENISEYIFDIVDNVIEDEEVKELEEVYRKYYYWIEELKLKD